jgi:hypothetical protein
MFAADDEAGKILRPADNSSYENGQVDLVATAPSGKLRLDGAVVQVEEPFPNVFHASLMALPGIHSLVLTWEGGVTEVHFYVGANPPVASVPPASAGSGRSVYPVPCPESAWAFCVQRRLFRLPRS